MRNSMKKRIMSFLLAFSIMVSMFVNVPLRAEASTITEGKCGDNLTWTLDTDGLLTISGTGEMYNYDSYMNRSPWRDYKSSIHKVLITEGVISIGNYAFDGCDYVISVECEENIKTIGDYAFFDCQNLKDIKFSDSITSFGTGAFLMCKSLTDIKLPDELISIGERAFASCSDLNKIEFSDGLTSIGAGAFANCD